jgi:hypothetical protein
MATWLLLLLALPACNIHATTAWTLVATTTAATLQASSILPCSTCAALPVSCTTTHRHILLLLLLVVALATLVPSCRSIFDWTHPCCCCAGVVGFQGVNKPCLPAWCATLTWRTLKRECVVAAGALPHVFNGVTRQQLCTRPLLQT